MLGRWIKEFFTDRQIKEDAELGVTTVDNLVVNALGPRPQFDPVNNVLHKQAGETLLKRVEAGEAQEDLRKIDEQLTQHPSPKVLHARMLGAAIVEGLGCIKIAEALGFENPERVIFGLGLAAIIIVGTRVLSKMIGNGSDFKSLLRNPWFYVTSILYFLLVFALATLRYSDGSGNEGTSTGEDLAFALVMTFITLGPSWLYEHSRILREPIVQLEKERKNKRRFIVQIESQVRGAERFMNQFARQQEAWDREAARMRAHYAMIHSREKSRISRSQENTKPVPESRNLPAVRNSNFHKGENENE